MTVPTQRGRVTFAIVWCDSPVASASRRSDTPAVRAVRMASSRAATAKRTCSAVRAATPVGSAATGSVPHVVATLEVSADRVDALLRDRRLATVKPCLRFGLNSLHAFRERLRLAAVVGVCHAVNILDSAEGVKRFDT
mgnify:CR=1 FL=1